MSICLHVFSNTIKSNSYPVLRKKLPPVRSVSRSCMSVAKGAEWYAWRGNCEHRHLQTTWNRWGHGHMSGGPNMERDCPAMHTYAPSFYWNLNGVCAYPNYIRTIFYISLVVYCKISTRITAVCSFSGRLISSIVCFFLHLKIEFHSCARGIIHNH